MTKTISSKPGSVARVAFAAVGLLPSIAHVTEPSRINADATIEVPLGLRFKRFADRVYLGM